METLSKIIIIFQNPGHTEVLWEQRGGIQDDRWEWRLPRWLLRATPAQSGQQSTPAEYWLQILDFKYCILHCRLQSGTGQHVSLQFQGTKEPGSPWKHRHQWLLLNSSILTHVYLNLGNRITNECKYFVQTWKRQFLQGFGPQYALQSLAWNKFRYKSWRRMWSEFSAA